MPRRLHAFIDFFNATALPQTRRPNLADYRDGLDRVISQVINITEELLPNPEEIVGRLYGGWFSSHTGRSTEAKDILETVVRQNYPTRRPQRIRMQVAESLLVAPGHRLEATMRLIPGLPNFHIGSTPTYCANPRDCPLESLKAWKQGRCPESGCLVRAEEVCRRIGQKMVDTAMCCDILAIAQDPSAGDWIVGVSNDDDLVPALLMAARLRGQVARLRQTRLATRHYDRILNSNGVVCVEY